MFEEYFEYIFEQPHIVTVLEDLVQNHRFSSDIAKELIKEFAEESDDFIKYVDDKLHTGSE